MANVAVIDADRVPAHLNPDTGLTVRPTVGTQTGFEALEQAVLELGAGSSKSIDVGPAEETLFVLDGEGTVTVAGERHALEPEVGLYLPPGSTFELHNPGPSTLRVVAVRVPDPVQNGTAQPRPAVCRLEDSELEAATAQREFRIVADPSTGLRSATHFVGYIPVERAPDHFHYYDEVIYVLDGEGVMHAGEFRPPSVAGSLYTAAGTHCALPREHRHGADARRRSVQAGRLAGGRLLPGRDARLSGRRNGSKSIGGCSSYERTYVLSRVGAGCAGRGGLRKQQQ